ncbi:hypothetical protein BKA83DRAFT_2884842 [Pisolithus microcarpus]|nr:hypothetical protein BKA83DRAFT_2884842 [Pisolithus microcarpus]
MVTLSSCRPPRTGHITGLSLSSHVHATTPPRQSGFDSHTFGHPTPADNTSALEPACAPPSLPLLYHPELAAALAARHKAAIVSRPVHIHALDLYSSARDACELSRNKRDRRRTRTVSGRPRNLRRPSAEWNAQQAVSGRTWPAEVSREILRLSLGEGSGTPSGGVSGSSAEHKSQTRGHSTHDFPDRAPISPSSSFFPSTTPPPERDPGLPKGPVALPGIKLYYFLVRFFGLNWIFVPQTSAPSPHVSDVPLPPFTDTALGIADRVD